MKVCPACAFYNRESAELCDLCSSPLPKPTTDQLKLRLTQLFPEQGTICFQIGHRSLSFSPQENETLLIGRIDPQGGDVPQIDLTQFSAYRMGVSRRHAEVKRSRRILEIMDLGSSNGTFLNQERLMPYKPYCLRHGDQLLIGQLAATIIFEVGEIVPHLPPTSVSPQQAFVNHLNSLQTQRTTPVDTEQLKAVLQSVLKEYHTKPADPH